jgi:germacradienol/geosmin synthase
VGLNRLKSFTHVPHQVVAPVALPKFYMPYPARLSPHLDAARERLITWGREMGMLDPAPGVVGGALWSEHDLRTFDFALCAAGLDPDATPPELDLSSAWLAWGTYGDDYYPAVFGRNRDMAGAKAQNQRLSAFMPIADTPIPTPVNAQERGLVDLWARTTSSMTTDHKHQFRCGVQDMIDSWLWELAGEILNRIPDPVDYVEMRRKTFGSSMTMALARTSHGQQVPAEIYQTQTVQSLENTAKDYACLLNDIFSYQKEIQFEGEVHNCVLVVQNFLDCDQQRAIKVVNDLTTARMRQFERIVATELPTLYEQHHLDEQARKMLNQRAAELQDWMAGILNWHVNCGRYRETELLRRYRARVMPTIAGPTGLGTNTTKISSLLAYGSLTIGERQS